jgi:hypothetical protein
METATNIGIANTIEIPKRLGHIMVDLETMGNKSNSVICSIGAVEFDINTGETGREFYVKVDMQSCLERGMIVNADTIEWWLMQNEAARLKVAMGDGMNITQALHGFKLFLEDLGANTVQIWGNSVRFDMGILEDAYRACKLKEPWNFRCERDVRTLVALAPYIKEHYPKSGVEHDPIDDCKYQIGYCTAIWQILCGTVKI